jgi:drug/metabolite transporter (DMT)-like permease
MLFATLGFSIMQAFIKQVSHIHIFQIIFFRSAITAVMSTSFLIKNKISLKGNSQLLLIQRAVLGIISMTLFFITIQRIPFGASVTLKYLSPIFAIILAFLFLKEKIKPIQWLFFLIALLGIFMLKGYDPRIDTLSFILAILGAFFGGCVYVTIRKIGTSEHPLVIVNYFMGSAAILSGILMIGNWELTSFIDFTILIFIGISGYIGQKYMTESFQLEETNFVAPLKYTELIYAFLIGYVFFNEIYDIDACVGILLLIVSFTLNHRYGKREPVSKTKK